MTKNRRRLSVTPLEGRDVPASFGVPWADPTHLTLSFAPDGTSVSGVSSNLAATLDAQMPTATWHAAILRAVQIWSASANINIGVVTDSGAAFGSAGATQADTRFGDIRIAGLPMAGDALGEAVPPDPLLAGTLAGDVFFNTNTTYTPAKLTSVALHELGHALGLAPSAGRGSVMFNGFTGRQALNSADTLAIRTLYGTKPADPAEGNGSFGRATPIPDSTEGEGKTPLIAYGTLASRSDVDFFRFTNLATYSGPITIRSQTVGISLVPVRVTVYDAQRKLIGQATGTGAEGGVVTFTIPNSLSGQAYFVRIDAAPGAVARTGRYGVAVTFDNNFRPPAISIDAVLRGPYEALSPDDMEKFFKDPTRALYREDGGSDDSTGGADDLGAARGPQAFTRFIATGSISNNSDVDNYRIESPRVGAKVALTLVATVRSLGPNGVTPRVDVLDKDQNPVPAEIVANGAGRFTVQVRGIASAERYYLRVANPTGEAGNYALEATFRTKAVDFQQFATGTVTDTQSIQYKLYIGRTELFGFALSASGPAGAAVRMTITDSSNNIMFDLTGHAGDTVSGLSTFLPPGEYTVEFTSVGTAQPVGFTVRGDVQTDPIGPQPGGTALSPKYPDPNNPGGFLYPTGTATLTPYLFVLRLI